MKKLFSQLKPIASGLFFFVPIAVGGVLLALASTRRAEPEKRPEQEQARQLRTIEVQPITVVPRAVGFGESQASKMFQAVAEVKGKIIELHPDLKAGSFIRKGELLVAIDTTDVELSIQRLKAEIARSEASLAELKATEENLQAALKIEQSSLELSKRELARMEQLENQSNAVSQAEVDQQRRSVLAQQQSVQNLNSSLNLIPVQIQSAEAAIAVSESNLSTSKRDLERCRIAAPFDCRVGPVDLELNEFVSVGMQLLSAQSIDTIEVEAQFALSKLASLVRPSMNVSDNPIVQSLIKTNSSEGNLSATPQEILRSFFDVEATVLYGASGVFASREAKFERIREQLDSQARTVGIVVSIDMPYELSGRTGDNSPPPVPGTYCEVELRAKPLENVIVVPRSAIRDGCVYVVKENAEEGYTGNRLYKQPVGLGLVQNSFAVVESGLEVGDQVVVSDPTPAIEGMLVEAEVDAKLEESIRVQAGKLGVIR